MSATASKQSWKTRIAAFLRSVADRLDPAKIGAPSQTAQLSGWSWGGFAKKLFRRLLIWIVALGVAFYIPTVVAGLPYPLAGWENRVVQAGRFTDAFLGTIAMVVLSASDLFDNILARRGPKAHILSVAGAWIIMVAYFFFVFFGMPLYGTLTGIPDPKALPWGVMESLLAVGLFGEFIIATTPD